MNRIGRFLPKSNGIAKARKKEILSRAAEVVKINTLSNSGAFLDSFGTIIGAGNVVAGATGICAGQHFAGAFALGVAAFVRETCLTTHKVALKGAREIAQTLKTNGFKHDEISVVVKKSLSNNGNVIFSNLFKVLYPKRVDKIADGIETRSGFLSLMKFKIPRKKSI